MGDFMRFAPPPELVALYRELPTVVAFIAETRLNGEGNNPNPAVYMVQSVIIDKDRAETLRDRIASLSRLGSLAGTSQADFEPASVHTGPAMSVVKRRIPAFTQDILPEFLSLLEQFVLAAPVFVWAESAQERSERGAELFSEDRARTACLEALAHFMTRRSPEVFNFIFDAHSAERDAADKATVQRVHCECRFCPDIRVAHVRVDDEILLSTADIMSRYTRCQVARAGDLFRREPLSVIAPVMDARSGVLFDSPQRFIADVPSAATV